jgi:hypothetical protein
LRRRCYKQIDLLRIRDFVSDSDLDFGEKRVLLRLINYVMEKRRRRGSRVLPDPDFYLETLLLKPIMEDLPEELVILKLSNRKEGQDEQFTIQIA